MTDREVFEFVLTLHKYSLIGDFCSNKRVRLSEFKGWVYTDVRFDVKSDCEMQNFYLPLCGMDKHDVVLNQLIQAGKISLMYTGTEEPEPINLSDWFSEPDSDEDLVGPAEPASLSFA